MGIQVIDFYSNCRTTPTHATLIKRASELRDILGLAKCSALLSRVLEQQSTNTTLDHPTEEDEARPQTPFTLRAEANEWTPPTGTESPRNILQKVLHLGLNVNTANREMEAKSLLPPFVESFKIVPVVQPGTYYIPTGVAKSETPTDLTGDGKQFISSLSAKKDVHPAPPPQKPIAPPNKRPAPPGLPLHPTQQPHSFPLNASLLPQTFSVHLLSTLHMRFQHVSAALEMLDSVYSNEMSNTVGIQSPVSSRWESWMSPDGTAGMTRALLELRKALDELCGATARAGWIVDTWGVYQGGMLEGSKQSEPELGSAAINGVEISGEGEMKQSIQTPIGRPTAEKKNVTSQPDTTPIAVPNSYRIMNGKVVNGSLVVGEAPIADIAGDTPQISKTKKSDTTSYGKATIVPAVPVVGKFRPPPGLQFPLSSPGSGDSPNSAMMYSSKRFPAAAVSGAGKGVAEPPAGILQKGRLSVKDQIDLLKRTQQVSAGMTAA